MVGPPVELERKRRPVGSQVFVPSSQGAASGFESEKCRQMKLGDKPVVHPHNCLHAPFLRQVKPKQWDRPDFRCVLCAAGGGLPGVIEAK